MPLRRDDSNPALDRYASAAHGAGVSAAYRNRRCALARTCAMVMVSAACLGQSCASTSEVLPDTTGTVGQQQVLGFQPTAPLIADAGLDLVVKPGATVLLNGAVVDNQTGAAPKSQWTQIAGPEVTLIGSFRLRPSFVAPRADDGTTLTFTLTLTSGDVSATDDVNVVISRTAGSEAGAEALPLFADAGLDQYVAPGAEVRLDGSRSAAPDGGFITTNWQQIAGPSVFLRGSFAARPVFTAPHVTADTTLTFSLTVSDGAGSATDTTNVIVVAAPFSEADITLTAVPPRGSVPLNVAFSATTLAFTDPQPFAWDFGDGTTAEGASVNHLFSSPGSYLVSACLAPIAGSIPVCAYTAVAVGDTNSIPIAMPMRVVASTAASMIQLTATDEDQDPLTYQVKKLPTSGSLVDPAAERTILESDLPYPIAAGGNIVTYIPTSGFVGADSFRFAVSDSQVTGPTATVMISVPREAVAYQSTVPAVTEERFSSIQEAPAPRTITRNDYMQYIQRWYSNQSEYALKVMGKPDAAHQEDYARREAFFYRLTRQPGYVGRTLEFLHGSYRYHSEGPGRDGADWNTISTAGQACFWVFDALTAEERNFVQDYLLLLESKLKQPPEYGAMNRSMGTALGRKIIATLFPNAPGSEQRNAYVQQVWNDWWLYRDTDENSTHYNAAFWHYVQVWLEVSGQQALYQDPQFRKVAERYLSQATPLGFIPGYGDCVGLNEDPGTWIAIFEKWATAYRDGRFRWAAHRMFEWTLAREREMQQWGNITIWTMDFLMDARLAADDSIAALKPQIPSQITTRKAMRWLTPAERTSENYYGKLLDQDIPDKLILRNGWNVDSTYAMVELAPQMGHGHGDTGSFNCVTADGSVLLADTPYLVKSHRFHNCLQIDRGGTPVYNGPSLAAMRTTASLADHALAAYADVHIDGYMGEPASLDRRILFLKDTPVIWVQDTLNVTQEFTAAIGPAWQTVSIYSQQGANWVDMCLPTIPLAYIWDLKYLMQWSNLGRDLLVTFLPHPQASLQIDDVTHDDTRAIVPQTLQNNFTRRVWWKQPAKALVPGSPSRFSSLLVAHRPTPDYPQLASHFTMAIDSPDAAVVEFRPDSSRTIWMGLNETGRMLETAAFRTDARQFVIDTLPTRAPRYVIISATHLTLAGQLEHSSNDRQTAEK